MEKKTFQYLALGDSYTIGEGVEEHERWPVQLSKKLASCGILVDSVETIATTGWTTDELWEGIEKRMPQPVFSMVSLLIGVNNQYRGYNIDVYRQEFEKLLEKAVFFAKNQHNRVFVLSIPDYSVTPFAKNTDAQKIAQEVEEYNSLAKNVCGNKGIPFYNITPLSRKAACEPDLLAEDGLHPSGQMYSQWVEYIWRCVKTQIEGKN